MPNGNRIQNFKTSKKKIMEWQQKKRQSYQHHYHFKMVAFITFFSFCSFLVKKRSGIHRYTVDTLWQQL